MRPSPFALILACACALPGCKHPPKTYVIAVDRSGSTAGVRDKQEREIFATYKKAYENEDTVDIWAVDRDAQRIFGPRVPQADRLTKDVYARFAPGASETAVRTRPALFWGAMVKDYGSSTTPVRIIYSTDGGNDFYGEEKQVAEYAAQLAQNPQIRVALVGVEPKERKWLDPAFKPFGSRADIAGGGGEAQEALRHVFQ